MWRVNTLSPRLRRPGPASPTGWTGARAGCSITASATGLLVTAIGNAPYTLTKHAAVAFAEWLSITYGEQG